MPAANPALSPAPALQENASPPGAPELSLLASHLPNAVLFQAVQRPGQRPLLCYVSDALKHVNGLEPAAVLRDGGIWFAQVIPADRAALRQALIDAALSPAFHAEVRMRRADGVQRWMRFDAARRTRPDGSNVWDGIQVDVTDAKVESQRLHDNDDHWLAILGQLPGGVSRIDRDRRLRFINHTHAQWYGRSVADMIGRPLADVLPPERYARLLPHIEAALGGRSVVFENRVELAPGDVRYRYSTMIPERARDGSVQGVLAFVIDVTEMRRTEAALAQNQSRLQSLFEAIPDMLFSKSLEGVYESCNAGFELFFGKTTQQVVGHTDYDVTDATTAERWREDDRTVVRWNKPLRMEESVEDTTRGRAVVFDIIKTPLRDAAGRTIGVLGVARDVTERKRAEREIERLAFYDALTGLPNRGMLTRRLQDTLHALQASHAYGALLLIDLDNFKTLNDTRGHHEGDQLLRVVTARLRGAVPTGGLLARFGGDEFMVLLDHLGRDATQAAALARTIGGELLARLNQPFLLGERLHHGTGSIGVVLFGAEPTAVEELLKHADLAMYKAKTDGRNTVRFFDPAMQAAIGERASLEADLRAGLTREELRLYYQSIMDEQGRMIGAEALVRWQHPARGLVPPGDFIAMAEESGLIVPLGEWVLRRACAQLRAWSCEEATAGLYVAVNVSARQFRQPDFIALVESVLAQAQVEPRLLKLELTESLLFHDVDDIAEKMRQLRAIGIGISLDDFGTGYSSLNYLKRLPLAQLKIDQSFVRDVLTDHNDAAIVRTILTLALSLGLDVVAEGVETAGQRDFLRDEGCRAFQGYFFNRPVPVEALEVARLLQG